MSSFAEILSFIAPMKHKTTHQAGGNDEIKLDELGTPTDVTTLNASTLAHGLLPKLSGDNTTFLDGTGVFSTPPSGGGGVGELLGIQIFQTPGSDTYVPTTGTTVARIFAVGGGGAGGGVTGASGQCAAAPGGSSGGWSFFTTSVDDTSTYAVSIGAAGTGSSGSAGGNGGDSTIVTDSGAGLVRAKGGLGGAADTASATVPRVRAGTAAAAGTTGGDLNITGNVGDPGFIWSLTILMSGKGGSNPWGAGAIGVSNAAGSAATGYGAGGGGASNTSANTSSRAGGNGSAGLIIVYEYSG